MVERPVEQEGKTPFIHSIGWLTRRFIDTEFSEPLNFFSRRRARKAIRQGDYSIPIQTLPFIITEISNRKKQLRDVKNHDLVEDQERTLTQKASYYSALLLFITAWEDRLIQEGNLRVKDIPDEWIEVEVYDEEKNISSTEKIHPIKYLNMLYRNIGRGNKVRMLNWWDD